MKLKTYQRGTTNLHSSKSSRCRAIMFSPNLTLGVQAATSELEPHDGSHVAPRGRLMEIAGSSRLLSPAATSDAKNGSSVSFFL
jgi:hypothetical protein